MAARRFEVIAHRGASAYAPENTLAAFRRAMELGARSVEFDVQQTKDGRLVVIHDPDLKRVARRRLRVADLNYSELSKLEVGSWFDPGFGSERVPTLEAVMDALEPYKPELQLEIKDGVEPYAGIERRVLDCLGQRPAWNGRVVISSFNHQALYRVRAADPKIRLGYLGGSSRRATVLREAQELGCESIHLSRRVVNKAWVASVHALKQKILVYTVNDGVLAKRLRALGVDGIFSNHPDLKIDEN